MKIAYARTQLAKSIFLAGPTPRSKNVQSWRPAAVACLDTLKFDGTVFVPEDSDQSWAFNYDSQIEWELQALHSASCILFWVPRDFVDMPAFTTNVEFGLFAKNRNIVLGTPPDAVRVKYLHGMAHLYGLQLCHTLVETCCAAFARAERPFPCSP